MLQSVRRLGKRVAIASIRGSCSPAFSDPRDEARLKDFDIIWLDDILHKLELKYERHQERCESPIHKGDPLVWTTYRPRKGKRFFCEDCRQEFQRQKREAENDYVEEWDGTEEENGADYIFESSLTGVIKRLIPTKSFGFITTDAGKDYFFHLTDLVGLEFEDLVEGIKVDFEVKKQPSGGKAGAAQNVQLHLP
jgi:CspA family cold shock protein